MKLINFKKVLPIAIFVLGILGAFATTSMQSVKAEMAPVPGYVATPDDPCGIQVECSDQVGQLCRLFYPDGPQAKALDDDSETSCSQEIYRP